MRNIIKESIEESILKFDTDLMRDDKGFCL